MQFTNATKYDSGARFRKKRKKVKNKRVLQRKKLVQKTLSSNKGNDVPHAENKKQLKPKNIAVVKPVKQESVKKEYKKEEKIVPVKEEPKVDNHSVTRKETIGEMINDFKKDRNKPRVIKKGNPNDFKTLDVNKLIQKVKKEGIMKKAINFGIVGLGQGGGRIANVFEKLGYPTIAINTSNQDLEKLDCKIKLQIGSGDGAGKDLKIGTKAVSVSKNEIMEVYHKEFKNVKHAIVCAGSSGGTGGGGLKAVVETLLDYKLSVSVMTTLPLDSEDTRAKKNTLSVLNELVKLVEARKIKPLIIVDNNKIEQKHPGLSTLKFWNVANEEVVKTFDLFNKLAATSTEYSSLDPADYFKIMSAKGCMIFGNISIQEEKVSENDNLFSDAIRKNINNGLFVEGFNLVQATHVGLIIAGNPSQLESIPRRSEENAFQTINEIIGSGSVYKGVYGLPSLTYPEVFFMLAGLGLPEERIRGIAQAVKTDTAHMQEKVEVKQKTVQDIIGDMGTEEQLDLDEL